MTTTYLQALGATFGDFLRHKGLGSAVKRTAASLRTLRHPALMRRMAAQGYLRQVGRKRGRDGHPWDPFHFISHNVYLIRGASYARRFEAALHHYGYEAETFDEALLNRAYASEGFELWTSEVDGHRFSLHLGPAGEEALEGDLRLRLLADGQQVGSANFVWADAAMFGQPSAPTLFITRCQTHMWPELAVFRSCFKQNSPPYFCLAALAGIGMVCGMTSLYAVSAEWHAHYKPQFASSFRNSYDEFWEKFSAERVTQEVYRLALPLALRDLSELKSKHRSRAEQRRRAWGEVGQAAAAAVARHRRATASPAAVSASLKAA
jgi:uncharacterized protein VirK/YbjX